jgi:hypothetical protein
MKMTKKNTNETINTALELTQKATTATFKTAIQAAELAENYVQNIYKAGYDANIEAMKVAKGYWDVTSQIRQDWLKLFASAGENFIESAFSFELPVQKQVADVAKKVFSNFEKAAGNQTAQAKAASK